MPVSYPAIDGTPNKKTVSFRMIDVSGDLRTVTIEVALASTDAEIAALGAALGAATNANIYEAKVVADYIAQPTASTAVADEENSVYDNIVLLAKSNVGDSSRLFVPAPIRSLFLGDSDTPDPSSAELQAVIDAFEAVSISGYVVVSARYTERREINEAIKF